MASAKPAAKARPTPAPRPDNQLETYQDLILKAQNLTLQQDRLQTSQVLIRGLQRETRGSQGYKELSRALDELSGVFYTEKAQTLYSTALSSIDAKPREAIEPLQEALKTEDRNLTLLRTLAQVHLRLDECDKADARVRTAEEVDPYSAEVKLLRLQTLACQKNWEALATKLATKDPDLEPVERFTRGLQMQDLLRRKETKKAKALLATWEQQMPDQPEVYFWKWELSKTLGPGNVDRVAAAKYSQLCQNLTPRKRQSFSLDVDLCKSKELADAYLKESEAQATPSAHEESPK